MQATLYIAVFFTEVVICATLRSRKIRQGSLLAASYLLYVTWGPWFAGVLLASTVMNYLLGQAMRRNPRSGLLMLGVSSNLALLGIFKYLPPVALQLPFSSLQRFAHLALPLGISFWTFQAMSYLFDLYRGEDLDPSFVEFALYMAFFPVTISGPVCRMPDMLPQFRSDKPATWGDRERGFARIATGVLMMQLARLLGRGILGGYGIASGFDHSIAWSGPDVWCLAFGYGLQLFFDFAGYSQLAIGAAQAMGFIVPENFARPFLADNPSVFWTRWHMSLSFWIRDYIFFPLAALRRDLWWRNAALVIAMILFGLWHKATWLFLVWGCYQGVLLVLHRQVQQFERSFDWNPPELFWNAMSWSMTAILISVGWIAFRANSPAQAARMLSAIVTPKSYSYHSLDISLYLLVASLAVCYAAVLRIGDLLESYASSQRSEPLSFPSRVFAVMAERRWYWIPPVYIVAVVVVSLIAQPQATNAAQFMYRGF